jgi:hypothetical protein
MNLGEALVEPFRWDMDVNIPQTPIGQRELVQRAAG